MRGLRLPGMRADRPGAVGAVRRVDRARDRARLLRDGGRRRGARRRGAVRDLPRAARSGLLDPANPHLDYPVAGMALFGLGAWGLLREATSVDDAVRLLVARRAVRLQPDRSRRWRGSGSRRRPRQRAPGRLAAAARRATATGAPPDLLDEAHGLVERLCTAG